MIVGGQFIILFIQAANIMIRYLGIRAHASMNCCVTLTGHALLYTNSKNRFPTLGRWADGTIKKFPAEHMERSVKTPEIVPLDWALRNGEAA